ncbi:hypothetical protein C2E23DRAFT_848062 [Lenzites betulinus]|nr:hypothetical protein C2E23DRAFT_848062 [Lenzites betulinus]
MDRSSLASTPTLHRIVQEGSTSTHSLGGHELALAQQNSNRLRGMPGLSIALNLHKSNRLGASGRRALYALSSQKTH